MSELRRDEKLEFLNIGTLDTPNFSLMGQGFTDISVSANPQTSPRQYVHQKIASQALTGYQPVKNFVSVMDREDPTMLFLQERAARFAIGEDAVSEVVEVDTWKPLDSGAYPARKIPVSIQFDNPGSGAAGTELALTGNLAYSDNPIVGLFNMTTKTFTASAMAPLSAGVEMFNTTSTNTGSDEVVDLAKGKGK